MYSVFEILSSFARNTVISSKNVHELTFFGKNFISAWHRSWWVSEDSQFYTGYKKCYVIHWFIFWHFNLLKKIWNVKKIAGSKLVLAFSSALCHILRTSLNIFICNCPYMLLLYTVQCTVNICADWYNASNELCCIYYIEQCTKRCTEPSWFKNSWLILCSFFHGIPYFPFFICVFPKFFS